jgi:hypothetical protein
MKLRRCQEDREDFTTSDGNIWPMFINKHSGTGYSFCPGKATWPGPHREHFNLLKLSVEMKTLYSDGNLASQPSWYIDALADFVLKYDNAKFNSRAISILGDGSKSTLNKVKK